MIFYDQIVGLDLSLTSTGIAVYQRSSNGLSGDEVITKAIKTTNKASHMERYSRILATISSFSYSRDHIPFYFIEGYSFGSFGKSSSASYLIELSGIVKYYFYTIGYPMVIVPPTLLKKTVTGKGSSKKEDMKLHLYKKYKQEFKTSDEADAFALMVLGLKYLNIQNIISDNITTVEAECISKVRELNLDAKIS